MQFYARKYGDQYIAESPSTYPATEDAIQVSFERLLMTSTPYQVMLMKIRAVYRWEDRRETAFYLGVYMLLWAIGHITGGAVGLRIQFPVLAKC